jgi:hypothetical protein
VHVHWLLDRQDPRTVLLTTIVILAAGGIFVVAMFDQGALFVAFGATWLVVSVGQLIWAAIGFRRWQTDRDAER